MERGTDRGSISLTIPPDIDQRSRGRNTALPHPTREEVALLYRMAQLILAGDLTVTLDLHPVTGRLLFRWSETHSWHYERPAPAEP